MGIDAVVVITGAFVGGVAVLAACQRMLAHYDKMNRQEHVALMDALRGLAERMAAVETRITAVEERMTSMEGRMKAVEDRMAAVEGRMAAVEGKLDFLIAQQTSA